MCSNVILGVLVYLVTSILQGCICDVCITEMQKNCKVYNEKMLYAEVNRDKEKLCLNLYDLLRCVARTIPIPDCLDRAITTLHPHTESPTNCIVDQILILELQKLATVATKTTTGTPTEVTTQLSVSPETVTMAINETSPNNHNSSKEEQKGSKSNSSTAMSFKVTGLVVFTTLSFILTAIFQRDVLS